MVLSEAYEAALEEAGLTDWSGVLALATEAASGRVHRLVGLPMLLLDVPITSRGRARFLNRAGGRKPRHFSDSTRSRPANPRPDPRRTVLEN